MLRILISLIPLILLFIVAFVLGQNNAQEVTVNLLAVERTASLGAVVGATLVVGYVLGLLTIMVAYVRLRWTARRLRKALVKDAQEKADKDKPAAVGNP